MTDTHSAFAEASLRLGVALEALGDLRSAVAAYDRAVTLQPSLTEAWFRAGALVHTMGHRDEAIGYFRRAADTGGQTRFGHLGLARALLIEGRDEEAESVLRESLVQDHDDAAPNDLLGNLLVERGSFDEAWACFLRAVTTAPPLAGCYYDLVRCRRIDARDTDLMQQMEAALHTPGLDLVQRQRLHLALGKAADDLGDAARAMHHWNEAQALRECTVSFDAWAFDRDIDRIIAFFTAERIARPPESGGSDATPILIIGMPRSGTTLVDQILSSHPAVGGAGELNFWNECGAAWLSGGTEDVPADFIHRSADRYLRILKQAGPDFARVTDKMPFNFLWAGLIRLVFPYATIIHCRRAPIDTALSIHQTLFHQGLAFPTGGENLVRFFRSYERLAQHWRTVLPANGYLEVSYESLTLDPEPEIRRLLAGCHLRWDDTCLHPERNQRRVKTPSKWQARQPINRNSVARWKRYEPWLGALGELIKD